MEQKNTIIRVINQNVDTSSILKLEPPPNMINQKYVFEWSVQPLLHLHHQYHALFIKNNNAKMLSGAQYHCNPFDFGSVITGRLLSHENGKMKILQQTRFGPIVFQRQILQGFRSGLPYNTKLVVNKTLLLSGKIRVLKLPKPSSNRNQISVDFEAQNFKFQLNLWSKSSMQTQPFFKFYQNEENSVGLSIFQQHSQFMEKLKKLKIFAHSGFYIKVHFMSRRERDLFLYEIMRCYNSAEIQENISLNPNLNLIEEKSVQNSSISAQKKRNDQDESKKKQIDEEIYNLLYENEENSENRRVSFSMSDAEFLFTSISKSDIKNRELENGIKSKSGQDQKKANQKSGRQRQQQRYLGQSGAQISQKSHRSKQKERGGYQWNQRSSGNFYNTKHENQIFTTVNRLIHQIESLLKQNKKLIQQNKRLKDENIKLRFKEIKSTFKKTIKSKEANNEKKNNLLATPLTSSPSPSTKQINHLIHSQSPKKLQSILSKQGESSLLSSRILSLKSKNLESPHSGGGLTSQNTGSHKNFTFYSTISNNVFEKPGFVKSTSQISKFIPQKKNKNMGLNLSNHESQKKKTEDQQPSTPFFYPENQYLNITTYESNFFRQYFKE